MLRWYLLFANTSKPCLCTIGPLFFGARYVATNETQTQPLCPVATVFCEPYSTFHLAGTHVTAYEQHTLSVSR